MRFDYHYGYVISVDAVIPMQALGAEYNMDVRVLGITGSRQMVLSEHGINLEEWEEQYCG